MTQLGNLTNRWPSASLDSNAKAMAYCEWFTKYGLFERIFDSSMNNEPIRRSAPILTFMYTWRGITGKHLLAMWELIFSKHEAVQASILHVLESVVLHLCREDHKMILAQLKLLPLNKIRGSMIGLITSLAKNEHYRNKKISALSVSTQKDIVPKLKGGTKTGGSNQKHSKDDFIHSVNKNYQPRSYSDAEMQAKAADTVEVEPYILEDTLPEHKEESCEMLYYIWSLLQEPAIKDGLSVPIQTRLTDTFINLLSRYFSKETIEFQKLCETHLSEDQSPIQFMKLYPKILSLISNQNTFSLPSIEFFSKIMWNLIKFKIQAVEKRIELKMADSKDEDPFMQLITNEIMQITYYTELEQRFTFIKFIISKGKYRIDSEHISNFSEAFLFSFISEKELDLYFDFMQNIIRSDIGVNLIKEGVFDDFFEKILLCIEPKEYRLSAFNCLKDILVALNSYYKRIKIVQQGGIEIVNMQLLGVQIIWEIALNATDEKVQKAAANFLHDIYKRISPALADKEGKKIREDFLDQCMKRVKEGGKEILVDKDVQNRVVRAMQLLCRYIDEFEGEASKGVVIPDYDFGVSVMDGKKKKVNIQANTKMKMQELLEKIRNVSEHSEPLDKLLIFCMGKRLLPSNETCYENGLRKDISVFVSVQTFTEEELGAGSLQKADASTPSYSDEALASNVKYLQEMFSDEKISVLQAALRKAKNDASKAAEYLLDEYTKEELIKEADILENAKLAATINQKAEKISIILSQNDEYFNILYWLLDSGVPEIVEKVWSLLQSIPVNSHIQHNLSSIIERAPDWTVLISTSSPYIYSYSLKAISSILESKEGLWMEHFVRTGGLLFLLKCLGGLSEGTKFDTPIISHAMKSTLDIIMCFADIAFRTSEVYEAYKRTQSVPNQSNNQQSEQKKMFLDPITIDLIIRNLKEVNAIATLLKILNMLVENQKLQENLLKPTYEVLSMILCFDLVNYSILYSNPLFEQFILSTVLKSGCDTEKETFKKTFSILIEIFRQNCHSEELKALSLEFYLVNTLMKPLFDSEKYPIQSEFLFNYLQQFLFFYCDPKSEKYMTYSMTALCQCLLDFLQGVLKPDFENSKFNIQLQGFVSLLSQLFALIPELLSKVEIKFDLLGCLCNEVYGIEGIPNKIRRCASKNTIKGAAQLIQRLIKQKPEFRTVLLPRLYQFHEEQLKCTLKEVPNDTESRVESGYVGLRNFGCTCYINSLLQQLFMMTDLRNKLLAIKIESSESLIFNLQKIFAYLLLSTSQYYAAQDFFNNFKLNGQAINVSIQGDVDEFFNILMERIDNELKILQKQSVLQEEIQFTVLQEIYSLEDEFPYYSPKEEEYLALPLDINGKQSIEEALDLFIKEEYFEGENMYFCEKYDRKIRASKRLVIKHLPKTVILILKRFEFNFSTMTRRKLNDYCEFPHKLDFSKWMKGHASSEVDALHTAELAGVIIHSGTAEGGHYYSYIKERDSGNRNYGNWFEFNDTHVSPFNPEELKERAFGSAKKDPSNMYGWDTSAYFLIYQRSDSSPESSPKSTHFDQYSSMITQEQLTIINTGIYLNPDYQRFVQEFVKMWSPIPDSKSEEHFEPKHSDTLQMIKDRQVTQQIISGILPEIEEEKVSDYQRVCRLAIFNAHDIVYKTSSSDSFISWMNILEAHLKVNSIFSVWFLKYIEENKKLLFGILLESTSVKLREIYANLIKIALENVVKMEAEYLFYEEKFLMPTKDPTVKLESVKCRSAAVRLINLFIEEGLSHARLNLNIAFLIIGRIFLGLSLDYFLLLCRTRQNLLFFFWFGFSQSQNIPHLLFYIGALQNFLPCFFGRSQHHYLV